MHSARGFLAEMETMRMLRSGSDDDAVISPWPPGHVAGALSMYRFLSQGVPLVLMEQWDPVRAAELIDRHRITSSPGTPFHLSGMIPAAYANGHAPSSLHTFQVAPAPVPAHQDH